MKNLIQFFHVLAVVVVAVPLIFGDNRFEKLELFSICVENNGVSSESIVQKNLTSNSSFYEILDFRWSTRPVHVDPLAYFVPTKTAHVQTAVRCAREFDIPVIAKSGGHSAELFSSGSADTLVISFKNMNKIEISPTKTTATIGPGAVVNQVKEYLWHHGEYGASIGICPNVGIGGLALGGGEGVASPLYGLTIDNVLEMEMVDAEGEVHTVNENENPDLFWALRGSGSGLIGIVTKFKLKIFKASNLKLSVVELKYDFSNTRSVFEAYQEWMKFTIESNLTVDTRMTMGFRIGVDLRIFINATLVEDTTTPGFVDTSDEFFALVKQSFPPTTHARLILTSIYDHSGDISNENSEVPLYVKMSSFFVGEVFNYSQLTKIVAP